MLPPSYSCGKCAHASQRWSDHRIYVRSTPQEADIRKLYLFWLSVHLVLDICLPNVSVYVYNLQMQTQAMRERACDAAQAADSDLGHSVNSVSQHATWHTQQTQATHTSKRACDGAIQRIRACTVHTTFSCMPAWI
jgi:hypothetical protein